MGTSTIATVPILTYLSEFGEPGIGITTDSQPVPTCAVAVASYGGARYAAKAELRAARRDNRSEAGEDGPGVGDLLPEPAVAA